MSPPLLERANAGLHAHVAAELMARVPNREARILDLGCGTGAFLGRLATMGYCALDGIDIALPGKPVAGATLHECDLDRTWPFEAESFDAVVAIEVIEHVENMGLVLNELARVLKPDGFTLITTQNVHSVEARTRWLIRSQLKQFDELGDPTHLSPVFLFPFERIAGRHGLRLTRHWGHPLDGSSPTSRPALRWLASGLRILGLHAHPGGDQLCMVLHKARAGDQTSSFDAKRRAVTAHY